MKKTKEKCREFGLQLAGLLILGLALLIFIGVIPFIVLILIPVFVLYFVLEGLKLDEKIKKIVWIAYFIILFFLIIERML